MADGSMIATHHKVAEIVQGLLAKRAVTGAPDLTRNLREAGLTSLDMVNLMLAIEVAFDIEIPGSMMKPENFRSIQAIDALVTKVVAG